nr:PREDICTED: paired mesoderm homeobox protein 2B-like [Struthio camelus australis]
MPISSETCWVPGPGLLLERELRRPRCDSAAGPSRGPLPAQVTLCGSSRVGKAQPEPRRGAGRRHEDAGGAVRDGGAPAGHSGVAGANAEVSSCHGLAAAACAQSLGQRVRQQGPRPGPSPARGPRGRFLRSLGASSPGGFSLHRLEGLRHW